MISLKYDPLTSSQRNEHYRFIDNRHCATIVTSRVFVPIELVVYHDRKEFSIYHIYDCDIDIMNDIFNCIYENLEELGADEYDINDITTGNLYYIDYIKRKYGV